MYEMKLRRQQKNWMDISKLRSTIKQMGDKKRELESQTRSIAQEMTIKIEELEKKLDAYDKTW